MIDFNIEAETMEKQFSKAYIVTPGFDFGSLKHHCKELVYLTDGFTDDLEDQLKQIGKKLREFKPETDVLIPVGKATSCTMTGYLVGRIMEELQLEYFNLAVYHEGDYVFYRVETNGYVEKIYTF